MIAAQLLVDELALLRAVCADPDDDIPRLVLADWYDDTYDGPNKALLVAHADFLRRHIEYARGCPDLYREQGVMPNALAASMAAPRRIDGYASAPLPAAAAWATRLFGADPRIGIGFANPLSPLRWDRGFPAVVTLGSVAAFWRAADPDPDRLAGTLLTGVVPPPGPTVFERVPLVRVHVPNRRPQRVTGNGGGRVSYHWGSSFHPHNVRYPSDLPASVFRYLVSHESDSFFWTRIAADHAFLDAGRVAAGLRPRHYLTPALPAPWNTAP